MGRYSRDAPSFQVPKPEGLHIFSPSSLSDYGGGGVLPPLSHSGSRTPSPRYPARPHLVSELAPPGEGSPPSTVSRVLWSSKHYSQRQLDTRPRGLWLRQESEEDLLVHLATHPATDPLTPPATHTPTRPPTQPPALAPIRLHSPHLHPAAHRPSVRPSTHLPVQNWLSTHHALLSAGPRGTNAPPCACPWGQTQTQTQTLIKHTRGAGTPQGRNLTNRHRPSRALWSPVRTPRPS